MHHFLYILPLFYLLHLKSISCLYEHICEETLAFKPYIEVYSGRGGPLKYRSGPNFYDMSSHHDTYVCLNGPAYLYFKITTSMGRVFDKAEFKVHNHECLFFNGVIGPGAAVDKSELTGIMLMGDSRDYRKPFIQLFTAPLFFPDKMKEGEGHYENVTSLWTMGDSLCTISKGIGRKALKIQILPEPKDVGPYSYCRLPYQRIDQLFLKEASIPPTKIYTAQEIETIKALLTNKEMTLHKDSCATTIILNEDSLTRKIKSRADEIKTLQVEFDAYHVPIPKEIEEAAMNVLKEKLNTTRNDLKVVLKDPLSTTDIRNAARKAVEDSEKDLANAQFEDMYFKLYDTSKNMLLKAGIWKYTDPPGETAVDPMQILIEGVRLAKNNTDPDAKECKADATGIVKGGVIQCRQVLADAKKALKLNTNDLKTTELELAVAAAETNLKVVTQKFKDAESALTVGVSEAETFYEAVLILLPQAVKAKKAMESANSTKPRSGPPTELPVFPSMIKIHNLNYNVIDPQDTTMVPPMLPETTFACQKLLEIRDTKEGEPAIEKAGICSKGKPNRTRAGHLLQAVLGKPEMFCGEDEEPGVTPTPTPAITPKVADLIGSWRETILELIQDIFLISCPRLPKEFSQRINNVMTCYLIKGLRAVRAKNGNKLPAPVDNRFELWNKIIKVLELCKAGKKVLKFKRKGPGLYEFMKDGVLPVERLEILKEQADNEFAFNYAVDMNWKMFATVLGLCMVGEESRLPLITTRFYTLYNEDILEPLKDIWLNPKDNQVFNLILGNFINGNAETWVNRCLEASYVQSGDISFRPPRRLEVNGKSEHNFFVNGEWARKNCRYSDKSFPT